MTLPLATLPLCWAQVERSGSGCSLLMSSKLTDILLIVLAVFGAVTP